MRKIETTQAPAALGPYSQAWIAGGLLFTCGQVARIPESNTIDGDTISQQAERCCRNIGAILAAAGVDFTHVVKVTCYLTDMQTFSEFNEVYARYFPTHPARSCVAVKGMAKGYLCEMEVIAAMEK